MKRWFGGAALLAVLVGSAAYAQRMESMEEPQSGVRGYIGGLTVVPLGDLSSRVGEGWGFNAGIGYQLNRFAEIDLEYLYSGFGLDQGALPGATLNGVHSMQYGDLLARLNFVPSGKVKLYLLGGGGLYYRNVRIDNVVGSAVVPYCDPWLFYCSATAVTVEETVGSRHSWDFGVQGGVGMSYGFGPAGIFAEVRYNYIWGPEFRDSVGDTRKANGSYLPIVIGLSF